MDIIAIDDHEDVINQYESMITTGIVGDITEMDLLDAVDIGNCDTVVIATGENLESSVLAVMHCVKGHWASTRHCKSRMK